MPAERVKRKLAAILSADVAGYSLLMVDDEVATVSTLTAYRQVMTDLIVQHRGRVVDSPGDNLLAEFPSVVDAMQCAVAVQKDLKAKSIEMPDHRKMEFRIGINLGDVIEEGDRIYGDGVNIAARLEALSEPGGICISRTAYDQIEDKLPLGYEYLGEKKIKNSPKPLRAYRVLLDPDDTTFKGKKEKRTEVHEEKEEQPAAILKNAAREFADRAGDALKVAAARPVGESVPLSPEAAAGKLRYAGFWIRSAAAFIDIVIVGVISQVLRLEGAMALLLILYNGFLIGL